MCGIGKIELTYSACSAYVRNRRRPHAWILGFCDMQMMQKVQY